MMFSRMKSMMGQVRPPQGPPAAAPSGAMPSAPQGNPAMMEFQRRMGMNGPSSTPKQSPVVMEFLRRMGGRNSPAPNPTAQVPMGGPDAGGGMNEVLQRALQQRGEMMP